MKSEKFLITGVYETEDASYDNFIITETYKLLIRQVKSRSRYINLFGGRGVGKTMNVKFLQENLATDCKIIYLPYYANPVFQTGYDIIIIDDAHMMNRMILKRILHLREIKQFILISDTPMDLEIEDQKINFKYINNKPLDLFELNSLICNRLKNYNQETIEVILKKILKNERFIESQYNPRNILQFLISSYKDITQEIDRAEQNKEQLVGNTKIKLPTYTIIEIIISVLLYLLSERSSQINNEEIMHEFNSRYKEYIELLKNDNVSNKSDDLYLTIQKVNLREYPRRDNSKIILVVKSNSIVDVIEKRDKWWYIKYIDEHTVIHGWIYSDYLVRLFK